MSKDLQTYSTMTTLPNSSISSGDADYISQSDAAELARIRGLGEPIYEDPELIDDMGLIASDMGMRDGR